MAHHVLCELTLVAKKGFENTIHYSLFIFFMFLCLQIEVNWYSESNHTDLRGEKIITSMKNYFSITKKIFQYIKMPQF